MERQFPRLEINLPHIAENAQKVVGACHRRGIQVCGVMKGCSGMPEIADLLLRSGCTELAAGDASF
jgi:predicted amino acid racemase